MRQEQKSEEYGVEDQYGGLIGVLRYYADGSIIVDNDGEFTFEELTEIFGTTKYWENFTCEEIHEKLEVLCK